MLRLGIRSRVMLTASLVVAGTLLLAGIALVLLVQQSLIGALDQSTLSRASAVAALVDTRHPPAILPSTGQVASLVQVVDAHNVVVAATGNIQGEGPVLPALPGRGAPQFQTQDQLPLGPGRFRVLASPVKVNGRQGRVYVATSLDQVDTAVAKLATLFAAGLPVTVMLLAGIIWRALGGTLRPVEHIREHASRIGASTLTERVPVPSRDDEISRLAITMNGMLDRLEEASRRQNEFIGNASHELKSPLTALRAHVEVVLAETADAGVAATLSVIRDQTIRMAVLIDDLLFLARRQEQGHPPVLEDVDLDEIVLAEAARLRARGGPGIALHPVPAVRVRGSQRDLARLLRNLGDNALHHARTVVTLNMNVERDMVTISVTDDGLGIPVQDRARVFERFTRLDTARVRHPDGSGSGLGLAIALRIAEEHGGTLTITDAPAGTNGISVSVHLPLSAPLPEAAGKLED